jgi:hypothetical protein
MQIVKMMPTQKTHEPGKPPMISHMKNEITAGTVLIKNGALLPKDLQFETEAGVPGWRFVKYFDVRGMDRKIQKTGWTFFCLAGEIKATAFGIDPQRMVRTAIERILAKSPSSNFNSLEITKMSSAGSERFPVIRYMTVSAQSRQIQQNMFLASPAATPKSEARKFDPPQKPRKFSLSKKPLPQ